MEAKNNLEATRFNAQAQELQKLVLDVKKLDIQQEWIAKWDGHLPKVMLADGQALMNIPTEVIQ